MFDINNGYFGIFPGYLVNRRLFRYFGSYSGISVILINRRTGWYLYSLPCEYFSPIAVTIY